MVFTARTQPAPTRRTQTDGTIPMLKDHGVELGIKAGTGQMMRTRVMLEGMMRIFSREPVLTPEKK